MKKFVIFLILFTGMAVTPEVVNKAQSQVRKEVRENKRVKRKVRRKTRRRVRRRVTRRAHFAYRNLPRYRSTIKVVPRGAVMVRTNGISYHYLDGIYYRPNASAFVIARPRVGLRVRTLPAARRRILLNNNTYFYYYGTFYTQKDDEYEVVEAPEGALVNAIPEGYEVIEKDGTEYYELDGVYYQEVETDEIEGEVGYEVVRLE